MVGLFSPKSMEEDSLHMASCISATGFKLIQAQNKTEPEKAADRRAFIEALMSRDDQGKNIPNQ